MIKQYRFKKKSLKKDFNKRIKFNNVVKQHIVQRLIIRNQILPVNLRNNYTAVTLLGDTVSTKINNRCLLTSRSRAVFKRWGLSRISFRDILNKGDIPGITSNN